LLSKLIAGFDKYVIIVTCNHIVLVSWITYTYHWIWICIYQWIDIH